MNRPRCYLILDDEESIQQSVSAFMEDRGYLVFQAANGEYALEILRDNHVDGAVVDIRLPGMDGNKFMIEARKILPEIKFVVHTGSIDYTVPDAVKALGITKDKVLIKPVVDLDMLCKTLEE